MQIIVENKAAAVVLNFTGHFNAAAVPEFERIFQERINAGSTRFVLNMANLVFISSAGLCSILASATKVQKENGNMVICALQGEALKVFEISGFSTLFSIYQTESAALKQLGNV